MSLFARLIGIITAPKETFQSVVAHPSWVGVLVLTTLIAAVGAALPLTTVQGQEAALAQQVQQRESFGMQVSDRDYEMLRRGMRFAPYFAAGGVLVFVPIMALITVGILFAVFNAAMGGDGTLKQLFSVVVHAGVVMTLQQLFTAPINYVRGVIGSASNLAVLLPMIDANSFVGRILAATDLFLIWYVVVLAIGLGVLYRRRTQPIAITLYAIYAVIVLCYAAVMSRLGGA